MTVIEDAEATNLSKAVAEMSIKPVSLEQEYAKNPEVTKEKVNEIKEWMTTQKHLPTIDDKRIILFYQSCYYDMAATKSCIEMFYTIRASTPEFFKNRNVALQPELQQALKVLQFSSLPVKDPNGYQIIYHGLQQYEASKYVFNDGVKLLSMAIEACLHVEGSVSGLIFLFNMKGVRLTHLTRLSVGTLRKFFQYIQDGLPVRLKAIHVVNTLPIIDKVMFMIKPFMKKELLNLIHFHSSNYEEIQSVLPKNCLPKDFGGDLPSVEQLHEDYSKWMEALAPFFKEDEQILANEKLRSKTQKSDGQLLGGLCID